MARVLLLVTLLFAPFFAYAQSPNVSNVREAINVIVLFCVAGGDKFELSGDAKIEGGLLLKKAGASAEGAFKISKSEARGLVDGLNKELSNVSAAQASEARACMKPYIDRIVNVLIGSTTTGDSPRLALRIGSCIGRGGLEGVHLWGPEGTNCNGLAAWGAYLSVSTEATPRQLCSCVGHGGPEGVRLWGPGGKTCAGIPAWGKYDSECVAVSATALCACMGHGNILEGHTLWGPRGKACGGMPNRAWGEYDQYCVG